MKISYSWLKWYIPEIPEAEKLADIFTYHLCEVESVESIDGDTVYDLNILPNRAHDLLGHMGVARELAGQLGITYNDPTPMYKVPEVKPTGLSIEISTEKCRRYMGRIVRGVKVGPSPEWVVKHLASVGQRSINNIVDATNLVLFDCGQPTHVFDVKRMFSEKIIVRSAKAGETMTTLDDKHIEFRDTDMVITDESEVLAIAGVKGGTNAEVTEFTTDILIEVANFDPASVRKTARRLGLLTDAAKRFENDLSPEHASYAMRELSGLFLEMFPGAQFEEIVDVYPVPQQPRTVEFSAAEINKLLGSTISTDEMDALLKKYGYHHTKSGEAFVLEVPALRLDLTNVNDMAEEIGRVHGYEKITPSMPKIDFVPKMGETYARVAAARDQLLASGYSEVMTYAFCKKGNVEIARGPKGKEFLRTNLSDGLKQSYELNRLNAPLIGASEVKIFEIGTVFTNLETQEMRVAYADKKGVVESTLEEFTQDMALAPKPIGEAKRAGTRFAPWSQYPFITRDIAVWVPADTDPKELVDLAQKNGTELLVAKPRIFDQFTKEGRMSLAIRLVFQSMERTLTDTEVANVMASVTAEITKKGWEIR